jgi:dihydropteroate synthase
VLSELPRPALVGVLNVTPDSFSDGGLHAGHDAAVARARALIADGASLVDVGGESTRPGSDPVSLAEELRRVLPVVETLVAAGLAVSVDTMKAEVARRTLAAGAVMINDVTALRAEPELGEVVAEAGAALCLMHMLGTPKTMQRDPRYEDVVGEVGAFLEERLAFALACGVARSEIALDPGIGFGKTLEHNIELVRRLPELVAIGQPLYLGLSRKRSIGLIVGRDDPADRVAGSVAAAVVAARRGAAILRVHDVRETADALAVERAFAGEGA